MSSCWSGPYVIQARVSLTSTFVIVDTKGEKQLAHASRLALLPASADSSALLKEGTHHQIRGSVWKKYKATITRTPRVQWKCLLSNTDDGWILKEIDHGPIKAAGFTENDLILKIDDHVVTCNTPVQKIERYLKTQATEEIQVKITIARRDTPLNSSPALGGNNTPIQTDGMGDPPPNSNRDPLSTAPLKSYTRSFEQRYGRKQIIAGDVVSVKEDASLHIAIAIEDESVLLGTVLLHFYIPIEKVGGFRRTFKPAYYHKKDSSRVRTNKKKDFLPWISTRLSGEIVDADVQLQENRLTPRSQRAAQKWSKAALDEQ